MAIPLHIPLWKKARIRGLETLEQKKPEENPVRVMFFHAYCTVAIEKHMQDGGLPARTRRRASREAGE